MKYLQALALLVLLAAPAAGEIMDWPDLDADETGETFRWFGGSGTAQAVGTFSGEAKATLEWSSGLGFIPVEGCRFGEPGSCDFFAGEGSIRVVVDDGSGVALVSVRVSGPTQTSATRNAAGGSLVNQTSMNLSPEFSHVQVTKFGQRAAVQAAALETVWEGPTNDQPYLLNELAITIFSTDGDDTTGGSGAQIVQMKCLRQDGTLFTEIVLMNGVAGAPMTDPCWRVYRMAVVQAGATDENEGTVTAQNGGTVYQIILPNQNITFAASYTCPKKTRCIMTNLTHASDDNATFLVRSRRLGRPWLPGPTVDVRQGAFSFTPLICFPALTDIECRSRSIDGNADVGCVFRILHVANAAGQCGSLP